MVREVRITEIVRRTYDALDATGLSEDDITTVLSHVLDAELSGHKSHGFCKIPEIICILREKGVYRAEITLESEKLVSAIVNGGSRLGLVVAQHAAAVAIQKARYSGIGIVGAYNYIGTTGTMGY